MNKATDLLKDNLANPTNHVELFDCQMAELFDLNFPHELIIELMNQKDLVLAVAAKRSFPGVIPFIPVFPHERISFKHQVQKVLEPKDINQVFNFTTGEAVGRRLVGHGDKPYFLMNVEFAKWPERFQGSQTLQKFHQLDGHSILNDVESLMVAHFAAKLFSAYYFFMAPGMTWNNLDCLLFARGNNNKKFGIRWLSATHRGYKSCLAICEKRI